MNLPELARHQHPNPFPVHPLNLPAAVHVHNAEAAMLYGDLIVALVTDDGQVTTLLFEGEGEPLAALRAALTPAEEDTTPPDTALSELAWRFLAELALHEATVVT